MTKSARIKRVLFLRKGCRILTKRPRTPHAAMDGQSTSSKLNITTANGFDTKNDVIRYRKAAARKTIQVIWVGYITHLVSGSKASYLAALTVRTKKHTAR